MNPANYQDLTPPPQPGYSDRHWFGELAHAVGSLIRVKKLFSDLAEATPHPDIRADLLDVLSCFDESLHALNNVARKISRRW